ncbi:Metal-dependent hydrolase of the beta-lactamase superfamily I [Pseudomonas synxantha]|nr:Metal-dependent hydrolase of the beta-lactamase superfamily I [Pseudomonas synxantha]
MQSIKETGAQLGVLTHVGHALDVWLLEHRRRLPRHVTVGRDARII